MEEEDLESRGSEHARRLVLRSRVAVAAAIIKSKPAGVSGRAHAETLTSQLKKQSWRRRAEQLQLEVLRLRQELVITRIQAKSRVTTAGATGGSDSEDGARTVNLPSGPNSPELFESDQSMTPDLELPDPRQLNLKSDLPCLPADLRNPQHRVLLPHVRFLQALCSLNRASGCESALDSLWLEPDGSSVLVETVVQLLDSVVAVTKDLPILTPSDLILKACQVSVETLSLFSCQQLQSEDLTRRVQDVLQHLTTRLLDMDHSGQLEAAEVLVQCLTVLGHSNTAGFFVVSHLLSQISALADRLWQIIQDGSSLDRFPVERYQNSCYLFQVLEKLLLQRPELRRLGGPGSEQTEFLRHLERRVFLMSEEFPLFSIYMWRIGCSLTCSNSHESLSSQSCPDAPHQASGHVWSRRAAAATGYER